VLAAAGVAAFFLFFEKSAKAASSGALPIPGSKIKQAFVTGQAAPLNLSPADAAGAFLVGDCITVVQGASGFDVGAGDLADGENVLLKVTRGSGGSPSLVALPIDPRLPGGLASLNVPVAAISGGGDC
jgi:hypothetical protein